MRCHQHLDSEAVAACVACGRGLCRDCQRPTLDQRMLCGLPQCGEYVKRQAAVPFIVRQDCANKATHYQTLAAVLRAMSLILIIPSTLFVLIVVVSIGRSPLSASADLFALAVLGTMLILIAGLGWRFQKRISLLQKNWQDLSSEFGRSDDRG
ncbi:MAG TPA: hypothetical protein VGM05_24810 [Planctomycetaceae bacterium]|jgi:hypothetical protein